MVKEYEDRNDMLKDLRIGRNFKKTKDDGAGWTKMENSVLLKTWLRSDLSIDNDDEYDDMRITK